MELIQQNLDLVMGRLKGRQKELARLNSLLAKRAFEIKEKEWPGVQNKHLKHNMSRSERVVLLCVHWLQTF